MAEVEFKDFSIEVKGAISDKINIALEESAGELEAAAKRRSRVDTGLTKSKWSHHVDEGTHTATVGNPLENAIWEEFGTGEYAINGDGRKGGWTYKDEEGDFHRTRGKKPRRTLYNAFSALKNKIIAHIQEVLKGL